MSAVGTPALLHVVGYLTGVSLFALLLVMARRERGPAYRLTVGTAVLGVGWNLGELSAHALDALRLFVARDWLMAISYAALGFLAAVVVHAGARAGTIDDATSPGRRSFVIGALAYGSAAASGLLQFAAAVAGAPLPSSAGLILLTVGLTSLAVVLLVATRRRVQSGRAVWMIALALFAVSALHLGRFHGASESWLAELLGHHASIPLAFAFLYQDYRFAFADLFLKRALTLLSLVAVVFIAWSLVAPVVKDGAWSPASVGLLLAVWVGTALLFPVMRRAVVAFVDRILLNRGNYDAVIKQLAARVQSCQSEAAVLAEMTDSIAEALGGGALTWGAGGTTAGGSDISIPTAEPPHHTLTIGVLGGGRRLLSDDLAMLERAASLAGRRIDALRLSDERYERMLREREIGALAAEAELRALQAQINPHFLFNALTTIGYLIQHAPARALDTLMRLTMLLRSVLRSEGEFTTLGHERELVECYLEIERERFEERLDTVIDIPDTLAEVPIPALIVQPLVENAIKHGIAPARRGGRVRVAARVHVDGDISELRITVGNSGARLRRDRAASGTGIGLRNVERRLQCYYGDSSRVTIEQDGTSGETVATIVLPVGRLAFGDALVLARPHRG